MSPVRTFVVGALLAGALALPSCTDDAGEPPKAARSAPNVLIIVTDDQRADSVTDQAMPRTRHWFAEHGVRYPNAFVSTPVCCPSRATLMTGRYAHNHGARGNGGDSARALDQTTTLHHRLGQAGYRTAIFGKFLNAWDLEQDPPFFDDWAIFNKYYYDAVFNDSGEVKTVATYSTDFIAARALEFLDASEENDDQPWLMYVTPFAPHNRPIPEPEYADAPVEPFTGNPASQEQDLSDKPGYAREAHADPDQLRRRSGRQLRTLMSVDDLVDGIMERLGTTGERRNTLAFFTSDNGMLWGEHRWQSKSVPYAASVRVPLYARWPAGGLRGGVADQRIVANVDIAPTALDAAGIEAEQPLDGRSLLGEWRRGRILTEYWQTFTDETVPTWASLVTKNAQYVEYYSDGGTTVIFREYYDLKADPFQLTNLLFDGDDTNDPPPKRLAALAGRLGRDRGCAGTAGPSACP